eukprot:gene10303-10462_t
MNAGQDRRSPAAAAELVGRAFADGDVFLCVNVPPTWQPAGYNPHSTEAQFASTRPGVIWHCHQATAGDVEAVFSRRASVTTLQTWPTSHPLSLRDDVLAAALDEGPAGLPAWLSGQH